MEMPLIKYLIAHIKQKPNFGGNLLATLAPEMRYSCFTGLAYAQV